MASFKRGRIRCAPLSIYAEGAGSGLLLGLPKTLEPVAYMYDYTPYASYALLVRIRNTGRLVQWVNGATRSVDQRKAATALEWMESRIADGYDWHTRQDTRSYRSAASLAQLARRWRRGGKDVGEYMFSSARAAELLGMPARTYEGIEQGRGFRYPQLIYLAISSFDRSLIDVTLREDGDQILQIDHELESDLEEDNDEYQDEEENQLDLDDDLSLDS